MRDIIICTVYIRLTKGVVFSMDIGNTLKIYRQHAGLTQEELAYKAGLNEKYYGRIERNESCPTLEKLQKVCAALNIDIVKFFLYDISNSDNICLFNQQITNIIIDGLKNNIDIHLNRNVLIEGCNSSIWYNGFIGSMSFDEFELQLFAVGNIRGKLFKEYKEILELNNDDVSGDLQRYVKNDLDLNDLIEFMPFDEEILKAKNGNVLFIEESNWLSAKLINNQKDEIINSEIILDEDNILSVFANRKALIDYIFKN